MLQRVRYCCKRGAKSEQRDKIWVWGVDRKKICMTWLQNQDYWRSEQTLQVCTPLPHRDSIIVRFEWVWAQARPKVDHYTDAISPFHERRQKLPPCNRPVALFCPGCLGEPMVIRWNLNDLYMTIELSKRTTNFKNTLTMKLQGLQNENQQEVLTLWRVGGLQTFEESAEWSALDELVCLILLTLARRISTLIKIPHGVSRRKMVFFGVRLRAAARLRCAFVLALKTKQNSGRVNRECKPKQRVVLIEI